LNNAERPPAYDAAGKELYAGRPLPHFNEVDECAGLDAVITNRVLTAMHLDPATTLHDVRWGEHYKGKWRGRLCVGLPDLRSGAAVAYCGRIRQGAQRTAAANVLPAGRRTLKGVCKPGDVVWSRIYTRDGKLHADMDGRRRSRCRRKRPSAG